MTTTNKLFKNFKKISLTFGSITTTALLADSAGNTRFDISDVQWQRLVMIGSLDAITGTNIQFSILTSNKDGNSGATTDLAAVKADGTTAFATAVLTAGNTGAFGVASGKIASTGAAASNVGKSISILATVTSVTVSSGSVDIYLEGQ